MNEINDLNELYEHLKTAVYQIDKKCAVVIADFLTQKFSQATSPAFIHELNGCEQKAINAGEVSLCHIMLALQAFSIAQTRSILEKLTEKTLQQSGRSVSHFFRLDDVSTPLGMALLGLDISNDASHEALKCSENQQGWRDDIVYYLLEDRNVNPDIDRIAGGAPLSLYCLLQAKSGWAKQELFYPLAVKLIDKSQDVNVQHRSFGCTALHLAAAAGDEVMLLQLLNKGADYNLRGSGGLFSSTKKTPLLIATENRRFDCVKRLLQAGASPNEMPFKPAIKMTFVQDETVLTPFQTAVEMGNQQLIKMFVKHSQQMEVKLRTTLDPSEQEKRDKAVGQARGLQTLSARAAAEIIRFPENRLTFVYEQFHLQCYVENERDRAPIEQALRWLLEENVNCVAFTYWNPIRETFLSECKTNEKLQVFVRSQTDDSTCCYNADTQNDFYFAGGLSVNEYKHIIAHELGHYFAARNTMGVPVPHGFELAYNNDKALYDRGEKPHDLLQKLCQEVDVLTEHYSSEVARLAEYFTRACVQFPIQLYLQDSSISQETFDQILSRSMPHMFVYFQAQFMNRGLSTVEKNGMSPL